MYVKYSTFNRTVYDYVECGDSAVRVDCMYARSRSRTRLELQRSAAEERVCARQQIVFGASTYFNVRQLDNYTELHFSVYCI